MNQKRAVVTGGSRGIGRAIVERLLREGWQVCTCSRNYQDLVRLVEELGQEGLHVRSCNVGDRWSVKAFVEFCVERMGGLELLVNNASILGSRVSVEAYPEELWEEVIKVNINGVFYTTKYCLPYMGKGSLVVNVSSGAGKRPAPYWGAYAVSKFGLEGFSLLLAEELKGRGIKVYALNPGATRTQMRAQAYPEEDPNSLKPPDKVAEFLLKLLKAEAPSGSYDYREGLY
ncbi:MAG: SDR family oxidoreductase [Aquificaceae bacterium]|nr:SDR family oxidoreductase [Aquificaceae bacterium]MDW8097426.1 SDR family oxidoreductase [Aquificaceae bacterium]